MKPVLPALTFLLFATPALAWDECDDLWFSRNQVYDLAGYCFGSALGQAVFDNADCISGDVVPDAHGMELVAYVKAREAELGCHVDTTRTSLDVDNLDLRRALEVPVALSEYASGCLGWNGWEINLLAGPRNEAPVIATINPTDDIVWNYEWTGDYPGWSFVSVYRGSTEIGLGWMQGEVDQALCTSLAG